MIKPHESPPSSDQAPRNWQLTQATTATIKPKKQDPRKSLPTSQATIKRWSTSPTSWNSHQSLKSPQPPWTTPHPLQTHNRLGLVFFFFLFVFLWAKFRFGFFFFFFLCFVGGIFKFANFIFGFAKFLGFVGFFVQIGLLDLGIYLDGKKIAKKMLWLFLFSFGFVTWIFCDLWFWVCTDFYFCDFGLELVGPNGASLGATKKKKKKTCLLNGSGLGNGYGPGGQVRA